MAPNPTQRDMEVARLCDAIKLKAFLDVLKLIHEEIMPIATGQDAHIAVLIAERVNEKVTALAERRTA